MDGESPLKVTDEQLGILVRADTTEAIELDLGSLSAFDPSAAATSDEDTIKAYATTLTQALLNSLLKQPVNDGLTGRVVTLPPPTSRLPRTKPLPQPRLPTKWEQFAQRKGIQKRKRSTLAFDESEKTWKRRHGYNRANAGAATTPIIPAKASDQVGQDPFTDAAAKKRKGVQRNQERQMNNLKASRKAAIGGRSSVPATTELAATLPEHGRGRPQKRLEMDGAVHAAAVRASKATASMGKYDKQPTNISAAKLAKDANPRQKTKAVASNTGAEKAAQRSAIDKLLRERG